MDTKRLLGLCLVFISYNNNVYCYYGDVETNKITATSKSINKGTLMDYMQNISQPCTALPIIQSVKKNGCLPTEINNNICYGQCSSIFLPALRDMNQQKQSKDETNFYCNQCFPNDYDVKRVFLFCPTHKKLLQKKKVLVIKSCRCVKRICLKLR